MTAVQRIVREPAALNGAVTAALGLLVAFGVPMSDEQVGAAVTTLGALMILVRLLVVPAVDVVAVQKPGDTEAKAGPAAGFENGTTVDVSLSPATRLKTEDDPPGT